MMIETDRLILETMGLPFLDAVYRYDHEAINTLGYIIDAEWLGERFREALPYFQELILSNPSTAGFGVWGIVERYQRKIVGVVLFYGTPDAQGEVEIGFITSSSARRNGYCFEAVSSLIPWVLSHSSVMKISARCEPDNDAAKKVLIMLGFKEDGGGNGLLHWTYKQNISLLSPVIKTEKIR